MTQVKYARLGLNYDRLVTASKKQFESKNIEDWLPKYSGQNTDEKDSHTRVDIKATDDSLQTTYSTILVQKSYKRFARGIKHVL